MKTFICFILVLMSGCAHMTPHQYCKGHLDAYKDYDQCYAEVSQNGVPKSGASRFFGALGKGMQDAGHRMQDNARTPASKSSYTCTTYAGVTTCN